MNSELTQSTKANQIKREWHLIDAKDQTLGRIATKIAVLLMGKSKPYFVRNLDCGDYAVIINAKAVHVTGKKEEKKVYIRHSGYPGGLRVEILSKVRETKPEQIIIHAAAGMLPKTKLGHQMIKKLHVFSGSEHPYQRELKGQDGKQ